VTILFEQRLTHLSQKVIREATLAEEAISKAVKALLEGNGDLARTVIAGDEDIDRLEIEIEDECLSILTLHQPVAEDMRFLIAVLRINNDLERIGDIAANIAKRAVFIIEHPKVRVEVDLPEMAAKATSMVKKSVDALVNRDPELARTVVASDESLDRMRKEGQETITQQLAKTPEHNEALVRWMAVVRHLERLGDFATNIAEDVIYMVEGEIVRHQRKLSKLSGNNQ